MDSKALTNGVMSLIIPGLGQIIRGNTKKGTGLLAVMVILHVAIYFLLNNPFGSAISTLYHIYAGYDAYKNY